MTFLRRLFFTPVRPDVMRASIIQVVLTSVGVFTFLAGVLYMPALAPSRLEMIFLLLLLGILALLCTAVGQLAVVIERLERRADKRA
jgi:hypothetical protein